MLEGPRWAPSTAQSGIRIGKFENCHLLSSGLSSEVYRSSGSALKVIVETQHIEPHSGSLERKVLQLLHHPNIIQLKSWFLDESHRLVMELPFLPCTLGSFIEQHDGPIASPVLRSMCIGVFNALQYIHEGHSGLIHRDLKPSNILLSVVPPTNAAHIQLIDFGTCWHPQLSATREPETHKVIDVGTSCYRAPETLFGNRSYTSAVDIWAFGCILVECIRPHHETLFAANGAEENGNQLALITSIFQTIGTPTEVDWPEAQEWKTNPFGMWLIVPGKSWSDLLGPESWSTGLIRRCIVFQSSERICARDALRVLLE